MNYSTADELARMRKMPDDDADAYLFQCWKPGKSAVYASVDPNDNSWMDHRKEWPDKWERVTRWRLIIDGEAEVIHGAVPSAGIKP